MKRVNFLVILFFLLLSLNAFALTYRSDLNNGSWSEFSYPNTSFESPFNLTKGQCYAGWCFPKAQVLTTGVGTSTIYSTDESRSAKLIFGGNDCTDAGQTHISMVSEKYFGGKTISFDEKLTSNGVKWMEYVNWGYVDDLNNFTSMGYSTDWGDGTLWDWNSHSFNIPAGNYKIAFFVNSPSCGGNNTAVYNWYIDNVKINGDSFANSYLLPDNFQATYNRDFSSNFEIDSNQECSDDWCGLGNFTNPLYSIIKVDDSNLLYIHAYTYPTGYTNIFGLSEKVQDAGVEFDFNLQLHGYGSCGVGTDCVGRFQWGYVDDSNTFTSMGQLQGPQPFSSITIWDWDTQSFIVPKGSNARVAFRLKGGAEGSGDNYTYIDEIRLIRNNVGTFFKGSSAPSCSSIATCSNVTSASDLKSNDTRDLYWIVDYVAGATCDVYENGELQLLNGFQEMGSGMYYYKIKSKAYPSNDINITLSAECLKIPYSSKGFYVSPQIFNDSNIATSLIATNSLTNNEGFRGDIVTFYSSFKDDLGSIITDGNCTLKIDGSTNSMTYNSSTGKYTYSKGFITDGIYPTTHSCTKGNYQSQSSSYSINIGTPIVENVTFNPIQNSSDYNLFDSNVTINNSFSGGDIIFSLDALASGSAKIVWSNAKESKQYFIYTSSDGESWVFSDTLTFGATNSTPVQKIWNSSTKEYDYSVVLPVSTTETYYKLVYQLPAYYKEVINSSSDWINQNPVSNYFISSGKNFDVFSDSNYSNIQSYTSTKFQNLVSGDMNVGYELQFTAYGTSAGTLAIGSRVGSTDTTSNISVTTTAKRFSVPIAPSSRDAVLLIKSTSATSNTYYITDYAIVPRSYFYNQLEVVNPDNTPLQAILRNNTSQKYVMEGQAVKIKTSAYDISGNLSKIEIQTYLGGTLVKDQFIPITSYAGNYITFNQGIEGVIDLNGIGGELVTSNALRSITYKAILWNTSNQSVSEQYATVSVLQFPYFPNDFKLLADVLNVKLGTNPKLRVSIQDSVPSNFLGLTFAFFDSSHTIAIPNYSETIYAKDLGCTSLTSCTKEFNFDKYVWENTGSYTVQVTALINTENKNYTDSYTNVTKHIEVSEAGYLQVQMIQYMERHQNAPYHTPYNSTEKIPLMLGITDDTGKDLTNTISPYFTLVVNDVNMVTKYFPEASMYDETSGTTIWAWNQYFYDDSGNLLTQDSNVQIKGVLVDKRQTQSTINDFGFANRCVRYPFDIVGDFAGDFADTWNGFIGSDILNFKIKKDSNGWLSYGVNLWGSVGSTLLANGCVEYPPMVIRAEDSNKLMITIDDTFDLSAHNDNRQALYCGQKYDNNSVVDQMGDDFGCVLFVHEDLQQIDYIHVQIGNNNSDYSVTNDNKQYLDFTITGNDLMFSNTADLLRGWSQKGYFGASPTNSPSVQEVLLNAWHDIFTPSMTNEEIMSQYHFQELIGGNKNFNVLSDFNANVYNKVIFFKVKGLSTINAYDYLSASEQATFNNKNFLSYSKTKGFPVYSKDLQILLYSNSTESPFKVIETSSPIVINKAPSTKQWVKTADGNMVLTNVQEILPFHVISTMSYGNSTTNDRLIANLQFKQIIKANPVNTANDNPVSAISKGVSDILFGKDSKGNPTGIFNAPLVFITNPVNITIIFLILGFALIFTLMLRNVEGFFGKK